MKDLWGNSSEGVKGLDFNNHFALSHSDDRSPCDFVDYTKELHHNRKYVEEHHDRIGDFYGND